MDVRSSDSAVSCEPSPARQNCAGIYSPLDKSKSEIRLLTLDLPLNQPKGIEKLYASIKTFSFDSGNMPSYSALSYEWNPPNSPSTSRVLIIDGKEKLLSENLYHALMCFESSTQFGGPLWVDALCINQEDAAERNHQVQLMRRIYRDASFVFVWLGIKWTVEAGQSAANLIWEYEASTHRKLSHLRHDENYKDHSEAIDSMFSQSYWNRSWIIQELVGALGVILLTGRDPDTSEFVCLDLLMMEFSTPPLKVSSYDRSTNREAIRSSTESVDEKAARNRMNAHRAVEAISRTKAAIDRNPRDYHNDLLSLLARFHGQLATDPRDKVYSLLGIAEPNSDNSLRVDYTLTWTEVFQDAAMYVIRDRNDLEVLVYAGSHVTGLPSWVPDWLDQERQGMTRFPHGPNCPMKRCCSPHTSKTPLSVDHAGRRLPTISADGSLLTISASLFNIQSCSKADSPDVHMDASRTWAPLGQLGDIMLSTWTANLEILDDSDPELPAKDVFKIFQSLWWYAIFYFYPMAGDILSRSKNSYYITSGGRWSLTERQGELLHRALDEQLPLLTKVPPSVGSAILIRNSTNKYKKTLAKRIMDLQASLYIPGMCFWSPECGKLGSNHVLASIPLCRFLIILSKPEGSGTGYKVTTSARVHNLEHGQIKQDDGTTFELPVEEIDLV